LKQSRTNTSQKNTVLKFQKKNGGFTLIELMIVILMIGILSAIVVPNIGTWMSNYSVSKNANDTLSALKFARAQAINLSETIIFSFDTEGFSMVVDENLNSTIDSTDPVLQSEIYHRTVTIITNTIGPTINFNQRGIPSASGLIRLDNGTTFKTITLYATGGARIQ